MSKLKALEDVEKLVAKQGYALYDDVMDIADKYDLSIRDTDWLSNSLLMKNTTLLESAPAVNNSKTYNNSYTDYAQSDYQQIFKEVLEMDCSLKPFLKNINNIVPAQFGELKELVYKNYDGDEYSKERLIEIHLRSMVKTALNKAKQFDWDINDVLMCAFIGLLVAVDKYDPDVNGPFGAYANAWADQCIFRGLPCGNSFIYMPQHVKDEAFKAYKYLKEHNCLNNYESYEERYKRASKLLEHEDHSEYIVRECLGVELFDLETLDNLATQTGRVITYDDVLLLDFLREDMDEILNTLTVRERKVLELRYGFDNGRTKTLEEVGQHFGVTRERIRQIEAKALRKMRHPCRSKLLKSYYFD